MSVQDRLYHHQQIVFRNTSKPKGLLTASSCSDRNDFSWQTQPAATTLTHDMSSSMGQKASIADLSASGPTYCYNDHSAIDGVEIN